jgi:hypothetical protein
LRDASRVGRLLAGIRQAIDDARLHGLIKRSEAAGLYEELIEGGSATD